MAKSRSDVELRIRSRSNATKDIADLNAELDKLVENQREQSSSAVLATRSLKQLNTEQQALAKIAQELSRRRDLIQDLIGKQSDLNNAKNNLNRIRQELAELLSIRGRGAFLGDIDGAIKRVRGELASAEKVFDRTANGADRLGNRLQEIGVDTSDLSGSLSRVTGSLERAQAATLDQARDIGRLDAAQDEAAASARKLAEAQRFAAEQASRVQARRADATAGFAGLDQFERQAAAARAAEAAQERQNAAAQRAVGINERLNAVLARRPSLQDFSDRVAGAGGIDNLQRQEAAARAVEAAKEREAAAAQRVLGINERFNAVLARNAAAQAAYARQTGQTTAALNQKTNAVERNTRAVQQGNSAFAVFDDVGRKSLSTYQRVRGELLSIIVAYTGLYQAINTVNQALQVSQQRTAINARLLAANGNDARKAARDQAFLRAEAERLGFVYDDLAKYYANFAIAAKANGIADRDIKTAFSQGATSVRGLALSTADADGTFRAFEQILSKSRVTAEELRGQLGERLPGAFARFAESKGIAISELDEELRKGEVTVQEFLKFLETYAKTVEDAADAQSKTVFADINKLKTEYNDFLQLFIEGEASDELRKVVVQITELLSGPQGAEFAKQLGAGFAELLRAVQFAIENFETLIELAKLFAATLAAKAIADIALSFAGLASAIVGAGRGLAAYTTAARGAAAAGVALTVAQRGLLLLLGPVGLALAALATAYYAVARASAEAEKRANAFADASRSAVTATDAITAARAKQANQDKLDDSKARLERLERIRDDANSFNPVTQIRTALSSTDEGVFTRSQLEAEITLEKQRQLTAIDNINLAENKLREFRADEAKQASLDASAEAEAARAAKEAADAAARSGNSDDAAKAAREAERLRKAEETSANARANAARALQRQILDLDQQIFDARINGEARTAEEIQQNYDLTLRQIEARIAEMNLDADRLEQNARTAGGGTVSSSDAAAVEVVRERIELFGRALQQQAETLRNTTQIAVAEKAVNDLIAERDAKVAAINTKAQLGLATEVEARREALAVQQEYAAAISANIDSLIAALQALPPDVFAKLGGATLIAQLQQAKLEANLLKSEFDLIVENIGGRFAQGAADAFGTLAQGIAGAIQNTNTLGEAFDAAGDAFRNFIADFLVQIGQAILQAIILRAIMNAINGTSGGFIDAAIGAISNHDGGVVGKEGRPRLVPLGTFRNAPRMHTGGVAGVKSDEVPTILQRGEEVITARDPRHVNNGGAAGGAPSNIAIINSIDSPSVVAAGLPTAAGRQVLLNEVKANRQQFRNALGV